MKTGDKIKIQVTREDLKGKYMNVQDCPIARAAKREFKTDEVYAGGFMVKVNGEQFEYSSGAVSKANMRSRSLWGKIMGGFTLTLTKI